jgi:hypothetical protein
MTAGNRPYGVKIDGMHVSIAYTVGLAILAKPAPNIDDPYH